MTVHGAAGYLRSLGSRVFARRGLDADLSEELRTHIALRADDLERTGMERADADRMAAIEFGGQSRYAEETRAAVAGHHLEAFARDIKFSARQLWRSPSFTVAAVVTLAAAIGASAVVFSAVNGFILRPLSIRGEQDVYTIERTSDRSSGESYLNYRDLRDQNRTFAGLATHSADQAWLDDGNGDTQTRASFYKVSSNYFDVMALRPALGRLFTTADDHGRNSMPYVVLTYRYWQARFAGSQQVVGRTIRINRQPLTVIGVAPQGFDGSSILVPADFFLPTVEVAAYADADDDVLTNRGNRTLVIVGRLAHGVTARQAANDLSAIGVRLEKLYPKEDDKLRFALARSGIGAGSSFDRPVNAFLGALMLLALLILLAACANLGSLFSARASDRGREVALRLALGAGMSRILTALLTEALLVALAGGAVGLAVTVMLLRWLSAWHPFAQFPIHIPVEPDLRVYAAALGFSLLSGLLFGAIPIRQVLRTEPYHFAKSGARHTARRTRGRELLLAIQIAICAVLITSSIVAVRGLVRSLRGDFGFDPNNVMLLETDLLHGGYIKAQLPAMQERMLDAMRSVPGVSNVALIGGGPPTHMWWADQHVYAGDATDLKPANAAATALGYNVSPGYFDAAGTTMRAGRDFTSHDDATGRRVAIVNATFARKVIGSGDAIGRFFKTADGARVEIVGVVQDGKYTANLAEDPQAVMFVPLRQAPMSQTFMLIRSPRDPAQLSSAIRAKLRELDPGLPAFIQP
ncbi:MAG TPA: ABC transporter permease, partial [Gemmatimonadaceae bacterium]